MPERVLRNRPLLDCSYQYAGRKDGCIQLHGADRCMSSVNETLGQDFPTFHRATRSGKKHVATALAPQPGPFPLLEVKRGGPESKGSNDVSEASRAAQSHEHAILARFRF